MTDLPAPLTPADCDLRDFAFMPLEVLRLRDSDLAAMEDAEAFRAAVISWCVAWHQVPAASLPDDDTALCRLLGYGRDVKGWQRTRKAGGLRGWLLCSDGRLYHPVVAEKAIASWAKKEAQRERSRKGNARRWGSSDASPQDAEAIPQGRETDPARTPRASHKDGDGVPQGQRALSLTDPKGEGEGDREGEESPLTPTADAAGGPSRSSIVKPLPRGTRASGTSPRQVASAARAAAPPPAEPDHPLWPACRAKGVSPGDFRHWLAPLIQVVAPDGRPVLIAPTKFHAAHVRQEFAVALEHALGQPPEIRATPEAAAHG